MPTDSDAPLWTRSLAYSAAVVGVAPLELAPWLTPSLAAALDALPSGDPKQRARALAELRRLWLRSDASTSWPDDEALSTVGAKVAASIVASSPPSIRPQIARAFDGATLRSATHFARDAVSCDPFALVRVLDAVARVTTAPPTSYALGAVSCAALLDDTGAPRFALDVLRSLRARALDARAALQPFASLVAAAQHGAP